MGRAWRSRRGVVTNLGGCCSGRRTVEPALRTLFRENIMNRIGLCAIVVAALSVISFPVGALILNSAANGDASSASSSESAGASAPALSPDGKPVRVISLSANAQPGEVSASSTPAEMSRPAIADLASTAATKPVEALETQTAPVMHRALLSHSAPKRKAGAPQSARSASAPAKKAFVISGLF
jgi:hypothetical protein